MAKTSSKRPSASAKPAASPADALLEEAVKRQDVAKAVAISRTADFTGERAQATDVPSTGKAKPRRAAKAGAAGATVALPALEGREVSGSGVRVSVLPPARRLSLRAPDGSLGALSKALGLQLPTKPKTSASTEDRTALWLGPDEWLVIDEGDGDPVGDCGKARALHSAVDISHRNVAIAVTGPNCEAVLSAGCPQDLSSGAFPVGACSRTILGKVEIVLLRTGDAEFRVECWRSFSDYVFTFLADAAQDAAA